VLLLELSKLSPEFGPGIRASPPSPPAAAPSPNRWRMIRTCGG